MTEPNPEFLPLTCQANHNVCTGYCKPDKFNDPYEVCLLLCHERHRLCHGVEKRWQFSSRCTKYDQVCTLFACMQCFYTGTIVVMPMRLYCNFFYRLRISLNLVNQCMFGRELTTHFRPAATFIRSPIWRRTVSPSNSSLSMVSDAVTKIFSHWRRSHRCSMTSRFGNDWVSRHISHQLIIGIVASVSVVHV